MIAQPTSNLAISLLGSMEVKKDGKPVVGFRQKAKWMLAFLVLQQGKEIDYERLGRLLWPDPPEEMQVIVSVRQCVSNLNALLGSDQFTRSYQRRIGIDLTGVTVDLVDFDAAAAAHDPSSWQRAVDLYTGDLLEDCTEAWIEPEREVRRQTYRELIQRLTEQAQRDGDYLAAEKYLRLAITADRSKEAPRCSLMRLLMRRGEYNAALDIYDQYRRQQQDPTREAGPEMKRLQSAIKEKITQEKNRTLSAAQVAAASPVVRLPRPARALVGREAALDEVAALFLFGRLITLKGPPGIGKTHLAIQTATYLREDYPDGTVFFDLTEEQSLRDLWRAFASNLRIPDQPHRSVEESVCTYLASRQMLLVLDNCEHLIHAGAGVLSKILHECPYIRILTTSRIAWDVLPGERVYTVPPLALPAAALLKRLPANPLPELQAFAAVRLFLERVAEIHSSFMLTPENAYAVAQICHLLDGAPLALLLAAGWIQTLTPAQIRDRLMQGLDLLRDTRKTLIAPPDRLMLTLEAGYQALPPAVQTLFRRLSVFHGGWTLPSAEMVCQAPQMLDSLRHLQECSFVEAEQDGGEMRFRLLGILRQFGVRLLAQHGEAATLRRRHLDLCVQIAEAAEADLIGARQEAALAVFDREAENLTAALAWACESRDVKRGLRLAGALWRFWHIRGHYAEGLDWLTQLLQQNPQEADLVWAKALSGAGNMAYQQQDYRLAQAWFQERLELEQRLGDPRRIAAALGSLANVLSECNDYAQARALFERSLASFREAGDKRGIAMTQGNLAVVYCKEGNLSEAALLQAESAAYFREVKDWNQLAVMLNNSADLHLSLRDFAAAAPVLAESLGIGRTLESRYALVHSLSLSFFLLAQSELLEQAVLLLGATEAFLERTQVPLPELVPQEYRRHIAHLRTEISEEAFQSGHLQGSQMTLEETVEFAIASLQALPLSLAR